MCRATSIFALVLLAAGPARTFRCGNRGVIEELSKNRLAMATASK